MTFRLCAVHILVALVWSQQGVCVKLCIGKYHGECAAWVKISIWHKALAGSLVNVVLVDSD